MGPLQQAARAAEGCPGRNGKILKGGWDITENEPDPEARKFFEDPALREQAQLVKLRARILSKKGILVSDPSLARMNKTRWLFEAYQVRLSDEESVRVTQLAAEQIFVALKKLLVGVLGLNIPPIEQPDPSDPEKKILRWAKDDEFTPLLLAVARKDFFGAIMEQISDLQQQEEVASGTSEIDGYSEDDLEFFDELPADEQSAFWEDLHRSGELEKIPDAPDDFEGVRTSKAKVVIDDT